MRPRIAPLFGTVVHAVMATYVERWGDIDIVAETDAEVANHIPENILWDRVTKSRVQCAHQAVQVIRRIEMHGAKKMVMNGVQLCEQKMTAKLHEILPDCADAVGTDYLVSGTIDLLSATGVVVDWKTGAPDSDYAPQLAFYGMLAERHGCEVTALMHFNVARENATMKIRRYDYAEAKQVATNILEAIARDLKRADDENLLLQVIPNPGSRLCTPNYCDLHGTEFCTHGKPLKEATK